jgi:pectinesterase
MLSEYKTAWHAAYFNASTVSYAGDTQTGNAMALYLNVPPTDSVRVQVIKALARAYRNTTSPTFGTVGARIFLPVLASAGLMNLGIEFATKTTQPSYGYMLEQGPGTIWEEWHGDAHTAFGSKNHPMFAGGLGVFLYRLAGLGLDATHDRISIAIDASAVTHVGGAIGSMETLRGRVTWAWSLDERPVAGTGQATASIASSGAVVGMGYVASDDKSRGDVADTVVRVGKSAFANVSTIAAGVALVPNNATARWTVEIEPGVYRERVSTAGKGPLSIVGIGLAEDIVLVFGCSNNNGTGKVGCRPCSDLVGFVGRATLTVGSEDFVGKNLTIANDACGYNAGMAGQSDALSLAADRASFTAVRLLGGQDTLYTGNGTLRSYFYRSYVNGSCDSIYGDSTSVFDECTITIVDHIAAHGGGSRCTSKANGGRSSGPDQMCGFDGHGRGSYYLFSNCSFLKPSSHEFDFKSSVGTELGRAWGTNSRVILKDTFLDDHIAAHGWGCMASSKVMGHFPTCTSMCSSFGGPGSCANTSKCYCQNTTFAEYRSQGPGANPSKRVPWSKQLTEQDAAAFSTDAALRGWRPPVHSKRGHLKQNRCLSVNITVPHGASNPASIQLPKMPWAAKLVEILPVQLNATTSVLWFRTAPASVEQGLVQSARPDPPTAPRLLASTDQLLHIELAPGQYTFELRE